MNDDLISRDAVLDACSQSINILDAMSRIDDLPSVTPKQRTGHWKTTIAFVHDGECYCDKCKCDSPNNEKWDYCPNCGAKMEEQE